MRPLTGPVGKLTIDGEQVGGFRGWTTFVHIKPPIYSWVVAAGYWIDKVTKSKEATAEFYYEDDEGNLKVLYESKVHLDLPETYPVGRMILDQLKISFKDNFDWREL